jgi:hypothetical protein
MQIKENVASSRGGQGLAHQPRTHRKMTLSVLVCLVYPPEFLEAYKTVTEVRH